VRLTKGQRIRLESPGGGGYGPAGERALDDIARDLRLGMVSVERAERDYAVMVRADGSIVRKAA
jgi:N-methylhydantoinase B